MARIFISYRRQSDQHAVDRLHEAMKAYVDNPSEDIFIDIDSIPIGVDFVSHIEDRVARCQVLLAIIGSGWVDARKDGKRRLDDPTDYVRIEIAAALNRNVLVVPIFLDEVASLSEADLPGDLQPLKRRNGERIHRQSFDADVDRIMRRLGLAPKSTPAAISQSQMQPSPTAAILAGAEIGTLKLIQGLGSALKGRTFFIKEGQRLKIGRDPANDIVLQPNEISRAHCGVIANHGRLYLEDYQSRNGTELNGRKLGTGELAELRTGDEIRLVGYVFSVQILQRPA